MVIGTSSAVATWNVSTRSTITTVAKSIVKTSRGEKIKIVQRVNLPDFIITDKNQTTIIKKGKLDFFASDSSTAKDQKFVGSISVQAAVPLGSLIVPRCLLLPSGHTKNCAELITSQSYELHWFHEACYVYQNTLTHHPRRNNAVVQ